MQLKTWTIRDILGQAPVIPVLTVPQVTEASALAAALVAGGLPVLEVTLRSADALPAIAAMRAQVPHAVVGAGTVINEAQLAAAAARLGVPMLPGVATATELMAALAAGLDTLKFFPAAQAGGVAMLNALAAPFPSVRFCPTGGISLDTAGDYLSLPNVLCVGMSSLTPAAALAARDYAAITALARRACGLRRP